MQSKSVRLAAAALTLLAMTSCRTILPWNKSEPVNEVNLAFVLDHNLLYLPDADVNGARGRMVFGSATARTILDPAFYQRIRAGRYAFHMGQRAEFDFTPVVLELGGVGDAVIGADVWHRGAVTVDYRAGLLTYQKDGIHPAFMTLYNFHDEPTITVRVDGSDIPAIVDTSVPDTLVLPRRAGPAGRRSAHVAIAGTDFGSVDVGTADVETARLGNRLLSRFLVTIDYQKSVVGVWRDPRIPLHDPPAPAPKSRK